MSTQHNTVACSSRGNIDENGEFDKIGRDRNVMVNFVPVEYMRKMFCQSVTQMARFPMGAASVIFWLPVQMHYH